MELNKIYNENCLDTMAKMPTGFVDLVVTSPPYDNLREYKGYVFDFETIANQLYRITKVGGIVVWVVGDATINGSESGTSFRQALYFMQCGFKLHDTMIYQKNSCAYPSHKNSNRYSQMFEYMFVFSNGIPKTHNLICDKKNKWAGHSSFDGKISSVSEFSPRGNIWEYVTSFNDKTEHPAVFPEYLASDHIKTWSNEGDLVYDCFGGSGTTAKMAHLLNRNWILSEISDEYVNLANKRLQAYINQQILF
jgi:site-specific DNA-methyltransferase (adenine-specific)